MATITKRKHGYCVQIRRKGFSPVSRTFPSRAQAVAWAHQEDARRTSSRSVGTLNDIKRTTLRDILERYLREVSPRNRGHAIECYQLAKVMRAPLAEMSLEKLSTNAIAMYRDERLQEVTAGTVCRELHHIQHAISIAMREWGYPLDENPAEKVRKPKLNNARNRRVSQSEIERLIAELAEIDRQDVIAVINFAVETGMRRGEILTLEWRFVETSTLDLEMGEIIRFRAINRWDEDDEFDEWAKPSVALSADAERVLGVTNEQLDHCRSSDIVADDLSAIIDGGELVGNDLEFGVGFLRIATIV